MINLIHLDAGSFRDLDTGFLECVECGLYWCEHIEVAILNGQDAGSFWIDSAPGYYPALTVQAPIVPTEALWMECNLAYKEKVQAYSVEFENARGMSEFLGFIHHGEGRFVLRSMLIDWFQGTVDSENLRCTQVSHSYRAQSRWNKDMKNPGKAFAQRFSVWARNKCLECTRPGNDNEFDEDLVPGEETRRSPWS